MTAVTLKRWSKEGRLELTEASIDAAFKSGRIPPKRGRPPRDGLSRDDILKAVELLGNRARAARSLKCHPSYIGRVCKGAE